MQQTYAKQIETKLNYQIHQVKLKEMSTIDKSYFLAWSIFFTSQNNLF